MGKTLNIPLKDVILNLIEGNELKVVEKDN